MFLLLLDVRKTHKRFLLLGLWLGEPALDAGGVPGADQGVEGRDREEEPSLPRWALVCLPTQARRVLGLGSSVPWRGGGVAAQTVEAPGGASPGSAPIERSGG